MTDADMCFSIRIVFLDHFSDGEVPRIQAGLPVQEESCPNTPI